MQSFHLLGRQRVGVETHRFDPSFEFSFHRFPLGSSRSGGRRDRCIREVVRAVRDEPKTFQRACSRDVRWPGDLLTVDFNGFSFGEFFHSRRLDLQRGLPLVAGECRVDHFFSGGRRCGSLAVGDQLFAVVDNFKIADSLSGVMIEVRDEDVPCVEAG